MFRVKFYEKASLGRRKASLGSDLVFGAIYHVVTRGDGRQLLFHDDRHYQRFTEGLEAEVLKKASLGSDLVFGFQML